jgi:GTPase-associated protein 1, N-terminal domain type 1/Effector-associated domain 1
VRLEQAIYGASKGGHAILAASGFHEVTSELTSRLDLPDTSPFGVVWSPYLTGFPLEKYYVLARTMTDNYAPRAGMVFTHALIAPIDEMVEFDDLDRLVSLLLSEPTKDKILTQIDIEPSGDRPAEADEEQVAVANLLVSSSRKPVVRLGHLGFDRTVNRLWERLWPSIRRQFAFRLSFGPGDLVESPVPALVCTPSNLGARWSGYPVVTQELGKSVLTPAAALLVGRQSGEEIRAIAQALQIDIRTFGQLALLDRFDELDETREMRFATDVAKLRLVEALADGEAKSAVGRETLLSNIMSSLASAGAQQIRALRNLTLTSIQQPERLWRSVRGWMEAYSFSPEEDADCVEMICDAGERGKATSEWQSAIEKGLSSAKRNTRGGFGNAFWRYTKTVTSARFQCLLRGLTLQPSDEENLIAKAPESIRKEIVKILLPASAAQGLYRLHAVVASLDLDPMAAARAQLHIEPTGADTTTLRLALNKATPKEIVSIALAIQDRRLLTLAAESAAAEPTALSDINIAEQPSQELWRLALEKNRQSWRGPENPESKLFQVLDQMLDGSRVETTIITLLSETPLADLKAYKRRPALWSVLANSTKQRFMKATAEGWLENIDDESGQQMEPEIQHQILNSRTFVPTLTRLTSQGVEKALQLLSNLTLLDDRGFRSLIPTITASRLSIQDATALGQLIYLRRWSSGAEDLARLARQGRGDLKASLRECRDLLGFWIRMRLGLGSESVDEKWHGLADVCASLYPAGPDDREIWKRAGGDNADLIYNTDGRTRWFDAVAKIRRGYHLRSWKLLSKMKEDFSWNDDLRALSQDPEFTERH